MNQKHEMEHWGIIKILCFIIINICLYCCTPVEITLHGEITGRIADAVTDQPLQGVTVKLSPTNDSTITNSEGKYQLRSLTPGNYTISASKQNYADGTADAVVVSASTKNIDIALDPIPTLQYSETDLNFRIDLTSVTFTISKTGSGKVGYLCTPSQNWITINPNSGDVDNETDTINVIINRTGLTQTYINEMIIIRSTYLQYVFLDTINVNIKVHGEIIFNSDLSYGTVTDIEGNVYKTIQIGGQAWMAENLRTTKYNDNKLIPLVADDVAWSRLTTPGYCWYYNDEETCKDIYGALYNWYTVKTEKLCPRDWHVPTDTEWWTLNNYLGIDAGSLMSEPSTNHWIIPIDKATNSSGFTALPGSFRTNIGNFGPIGYECRWWSSTEVDASHSWYRAITAPFTGVNYNAMDNNNGFSIRCVKN